jgi:8-oxo-dGTP diphosphatase
MPSTDQGAPLNRYMIVPRTLVFLTREDSILLIKGAPNKRLWANRYNGIGGHIEAGEDVLTAAKREIQEETGLVPEGLWLCGTITIDTGRNPGIGIFLFRGECPAGVPQASSEGLLSWLRINELGNYPLVEDLVLLLPKILALEKGDPPISVRYTYNQEDQLEIHFG